MGTFSKKENRRKRTGFIAISSLLLAWLLLHSAGCAGPSYYAQAISGHLGLMRQREDIHQILDSGAADPELARELRLAMEIREFAVSELGLPDNGSYTQFVDTGRDAVSWNVVAAPEFSLQPRQWCFLVSGCVPYRGYFKREAADRFAEKLAGDGLDVSVSPAAAYSTLGWFDDPLLDTMLSYGDEQLAAFLFHELAHQELYVKGDTAFNEAYAGFVEESGVQLWLESTGNTDRLPGWKERRQASLQFNALLQETRQVLEAEYRSGEPEASMRENKARIFAQLRENYQVLVGETWKGRSYYESWFTRDLNNAQLALVNAYQGGACAFERLFAEAGGDLARFHQLAAGKAALDSASRTEWLDQPCD